MFRPLFDLDANGPAAVSILGEARNVHLAGYAAMIVRAQLVTPDVIVALRLSARQSAWPGLAGTGYCALRSAPMAQTIKSVVDLLGSIVTGSEGRIVNIEMLDQAGRHVAGHATPHGNKGVLFGMGDIGAMSRRCHAPAVRAADVAHSIADPDSGVVVGAAQFTLNAAAF